MTDADSAEFESDNPRDDWWDCPKCGRSTYTRSGETVPDEVPGGRECWDCEWSVEIPNPAGGRGGDEA